MAPRGQRSARSGSATSRGRCRAGRRGLPAAILWRVGAVCGAIWLCAVPAVSLPLILLRAHWRTRLLLTSACLYASPSSLPSCGCLLLRPSDAVAPRLPPALAVCGACPVTWQRRACCSTGHGYTSGARCSDPACWQPEPELGSFVKTQNWLQNGATGNPTNDCLPLCYNPVSYHPSSSALQLVVHPSYYRCVKDYSVFRSSPRL